MKQPTTPNEILEAHKILRRDPQKYLQIANEWVRKNPENSDAYFDRHFAWMQIGQPRRALDDLSKAIELDPKPADFLARGDVHRHLGEYDKAIEDYDRGEAINPAEWQEHAVGLLFQADCHARLGREEAALACCARLPEDFWTPGLFGAPAGNKDRIADQLRRIAGEAQCSRVGAGRGQQATLK